MFLTELTLLNFRSYSKHTFIFNPEVTILVGANAIGKTNILEAIATVATGKSFRAERDMEMIRTGSELGRVKATVKIGEEKELLELMLTTGMVAGRVAPHKRYFVNGVPKWMRDFVGRLKIVLFWPEDLDLVTGSPSQRRTYLNFVLEQTDWEYRRSLLSYEKGLRQRNKLLEHIREGEAVRGDLIFWDQLLVKTGNYITEARQKYIDYINLTEKPFGNFSIQYDPSIISTLRLEQYKDAEVGAAATLVGPHRDDILFFENTRNLAKYGSRGEQRLAVLWTKLAELAFVKDKTQDKPVLLLDDIFSELDDTHREQITRLMYHQQTIVTSADIHAVPVKDKQRLKVIELG